MAWGMVARCHHSLRVLFRHLGEGLQLLQLHVLTVTKQRRAILLVVILVGSLLAPAGTGPVSRTAAAGVESPRTSLDGPPSGTMTAGATSGSGPLFPAIDPRDPPEQHVSFAPNSSKIDLHPGGTYRVLVTIDVGKPGVFKKRVIKRPEIDLSVQGDGVTIESASSPVDDYSQRSPKNLPSGTTAVTFTNPNSYFEPTSQHTVLLSMHVPEGTTSDAVTIRARTNSANGPERSTTVDYQVSQASPRSMEALANAAEARAALARAYQTTYETVLTHEPWDKTVEGAMREAFTRVAFEAMTIAKITVGSPDELDTYGETIYDMQSGGKYGNGPVGKIAKVNQKLYNGLRNRLNTWPARNAGNASVPLDKLIELYEAEATAWRNGNRDRARQILYKEQVVLIGYASGNADTFKFKYDRDTDLQRPSLSAQASVQGNALGVDKSSTTHQFFTGLETFAQSENRHISRNLLPVARNPNPSVTTEPGTKTLGEQLAQLQSGTDDELTVSFTVSNGRNAGLTTNQGYLSISHSKNLDIVAVSESEGDNEGPSVRNATPGDSIFEKNGTMNARYPLTDIYESYGQGESNTYRVTFEKTSSGGTWFMYRAAFQPLIHGSSQREFVRFPKRPQFGTDQQGWPAVNVSERSGTGDSGPNQPPTAHISISKPSVTAGESVSLDGTKSTDDGQITAYEWRLDRDGDGTKETFATQQASVTLSGAGGRTVALTVEDDDGVSTSTSQRLVVTEPRPLQSDFTWNLSTPDPGETVRFRAATDADRYDWDLDGDGLFDDATGETAIKTFENEGDQRVGLSVSTADGRSDSTTVSIAVQDLRSRIDEPKPSLDAPTSAEVGSPVTFDAAASFDRTVKDDGTVVDGSIDRYEWDFNGDGKTDETGPVVSHTFSIPGNVQVTLRVRDTDGNTAKLTQRISVNGDTDDTTEITASFENTSITDFILADGAYYLTGEYSNQTHAGISIAKVTTAGNVVWKRQFTNRSHDSPRLIRTADGHYLIGGSIGSSDGVFVRKVTGSGETVFYRRYLRVEVMHALLENERGKVLIGGSEIQCHGLDCTQYPVVMEINGSGEVQWSREYGTATSVHAIMERSSDRYSLLVGNYYNTDPSHILTLNDTGVVLDRNTVTLQIDTAIRERLSDDGVILADKTWNSIAIVKIDQTGNIDWSKRINGYIGSSLLTLSDPTDIVQTSDGGFLITGEFASDQPFGEVIKLRPDRSVDWIKRYPWFHPKRAIAGPSGTVLVGTKNGTSELRSVERLNNSHISRSFASPRSGEKLTFQLERFHDIDDSMGFEWETSEGKRGSGTTFTTWFENPGKQSVKLHVNDSTGDDTILTQEVQIDPLSGAIRRPTVIHRPGRYTVTRDIGEAWEDSKVETVIRVDSSDVFIDGNHHRLIGTGARNTADIDYGVKTSIDTPSQNISVHDLHLEEFEESGIQFTNVSGGSVQNIALYQIWDGVLIRDSRSIRARNISGDGNYDVIRLENTKQTVIRNLTADDNAAGLFVGSSDDVSIENSVVRRSYNTVFHNYGIELFNSTARLDNVTVSDNTGEELLLNGDNSVVVDGLHISPSIRVSGVDFTIDDQSLPEPLPGGREPLSDGVAIDLKSSENATLHIDYNRTQVGTNPVAVWRYADSNWTTFSDRDDIDPNDAVVETAVPSGIYVLAAGDADPEFTVELTASRSDLAIGDVVELNTSVVPAPEGDSLSYTWETVTSPDGGSPVLPDGQNGSVTLSTAGNYTFDVIVSDGTDSATATVNVTVRDPSEETLSFEDGTVGSLHPPAPWYLKSGVDKTGGKNTHVVSDAHVSHGNKSMHIASYGDLREIQVAVDVNFTGVATVRYDGYVEANNPGWGDIKVNVGGDTISNTLVGGDPPDGRWYHDVDADVSSYAGEHTLYFWVRGDPNDAYFDNFRFLDAKGDRLPVSDVLVAKESVGLHLMANRTTVEPGDAVEFRVTRADTGAPVTGTVDIGGTTHRTDSVGVLVHRFATEASVTATVSKTPTAGTRFTGDSVALTVGQPPDITDFSLVRMGEKSLGVEFTSSEPLGEIRVSVVDDDNGTVVRTLTEANFTDGPDPYRDLVHVENFGTYSATLERAVDDAGFDGAAGQSASRVLPNPVVEVDIQLTKPDGTPAANDTVIVESVGSADTFETLVTDEMGQATIHLDRDTEYDLTYHQQVIGSIDDDPYPRDGTPDVFALGRITPRTTSFVSKVLPFASPLNVTVTDRSGAPVADAGIEVYHETKSATATLATSTDAHGRLVHGMTERPGLEVTGQVEVVATPPPERYLESNETTVTVDGPRSVTLELPPTKQPELRIGSARTTPEGDITVPVTLSEVPDGLSRVAFNLTVRNTSVAIISAASYSDALSPTTNPRITEDNASVHLDARDLANRVGAGAENVTLATVRLTGVDAGETTVTINSAVIDDDTDGTYSPSINESRIAVDALSPVCATCDSPTDPDGDGIREDVNGNDRLDFADVVTYFEHMDDPSIANNRAAFDVNQNGRIDFADVVELFQEI